MVRIDTKKIVQGDYAEWKFLMLKEVQDWTFSSIAVYARTQNSKVQVGSSYEGRILTVEITSQNSALLETKIGRLYAEYTHYVNGTAQRKTQMLARILVVASLDNVEDVPFLSFARQCLNQARAAYLDFKNGGGHVHSYTIGKQSITYNSLKEIQDDIAYWTELVYLEECDEMGVDPRKYLVSWGIV